MHNATYIAASGIHGKGLFAAISIRRGAVIGWLSGRPSEHDGPHVLWVGAREGIEVTCDFRFIKHADNPNACYYDDLSVVALRDLEPGDEITHNYNCRDW
jgi:SET domain-containing protein